MHRGIIRRSAVRAATFVTLVALLAMGTALAVPGSSTDDQPATVPPSSSPSEVDVPIDEATAAFRAELARQQAVLDEIEAQIAALDRELGIAAEAFNKATDDLAALRRSLAQTRGDLERAEVAYRIQQDALSGRAQEIYRDGELSMLDVLLGSKSMSDLVGRIRFLHAMGESDAEMVAGLAAQRDQIREAAERLEQEELAAQALEFELEARTIEVSLRLEERQAMLESMTHDLLAMLDERALARQMEQEELLRTVLAGVEGVGIVVEPGSPVETALGYHGIPYLWAGESPAGFDCSGLVMYVFAQHNVKLPHYSGAQFLLGEPVKPADLAPGDAVFFGSPIYHVGMYVGGGYFIHAPHTGDFVKISRLADQPDYAGARRYAWEYRTEPILGAVIDPTVAAETAE
jgi:peptidoglycan hydrolase CwlO-like protein